MRSINPNLTACPESYARLLLWGWDTIQEAYDITPAGDVMMRLETAKAAAKEARQNNGDGRAVLTIGGEDFIVHAKGATGFSYRLESEYFLILIKNGGSGWGVSVRYLSIGLWLIGWEVLRERILDWLMSAFRIAEDAKPECRISRADWCFDFTSPTFTKEFCPLTLWGNVVCHSSSKLALHGRAQQVETFTVGSKKSLQVQTYDKSREITDISGKAFFEDIWATGNEGVYPYDDKPEDIWRIEVRLGKDYLKARNVRTPEELLQYRPALIAGALNQIRLAVPTGDSNRDRWPMHPLWSEAFRNCDIDEVLPAERFVSGVREALLERQVAQLAGTLRTAVVLQDGEETAEGLSILLKTVCDVMAADEDAKKKEIQAQRRYQFVDERR